ncbi:MAG: hypothetical protein H7Y10_03540 [Flavobacterium sp.]|nr:hypothetical protein [Flavobacterium sp.]
MELFNSTGFEVQDKVFVELDGKKYFGTVVRTDTERDRIKVDYTSKSEEQVKDWFHKSFWKKVTTK